MQQLPLLLELKESATFESFVLGANTEVVETLRRLSGSPWEPHIYLWGPAGTGKSHLLQAICHTVGDHGTGAVYLPLQTIEQLPCVVLDGLENLALVCIDDVQRIAGRDDWELALRNLFERVQGTQGSLVITGNAVPQELGLHLSQLSSRLAGCLSLGLKPLNETEILQALRLRATLRGLLLSPEVERYLLRHYGQPLDHLFEALELLDRASLAAQRKLTVPFISHALKEAGLGEAVKSD
ncbi:MAG: DnaA regulatory inactivator Hda [Candidatus Competibacteraceae bacterium]|jgi:DnaA family protein|nr:DnaA regulatory inactivator Hda [Candidatus Competibacteraceae bacterium]